MGFSKGGFCRVRCHSQGNKRYPSILGPTAHLALRAPLPREAYIFAKPPSKKPLSLVPEKSHNMPQYRCNHGDAAQANQCKMGVGHWVTQRLKGQSARKASGQKGRNAADWLAAWLGSSAIGGRMPDWPLFPSDSL